MIRQVYSLMLEDTEEILGVRIETLDNRRFDLDLETFHKIVKTDVHSLESLDLIEYGDKLMTHDEFNFGVLVEDASENPKLLESLKSYFISSNASDIVDPKLLAKRQKRIFDIKGQFYSLIPSELLQSFAEFHLDNFEGNKRIYATLTKARVNAIHEYSRWRSRTLFEERSKYALLQTKPKKAEKLLEIMGDAEDWHYDGTIDWGYRGGAHCTLGHALRYQHFATSPSKGVSVAFGKDCISDFFDVPPAVLNEILKAQEVILAETKAVIFVLNTGNVAPYYKEFGVPTDSVVVRDTLARVTKTNAYKRDETFASWIKHMNDFINEGLPLTRSMLKMLRVAHVEILKLDDEKQERSRVHDLLVKYEHVINHSELESVLSERPSNLPQAYVRKLIELGKVDHPLVNIFFDSKHYVEDTCMHIQGVSNSKVEDIVVKLSNNYTFIRDTERGILRLKARSDGMRPVGTMSGSIFSKKTHDILSAIGKLIAQRDRNDSVYNYSDIEFNSETKLKIADILKAYKVFMANKSYVRTEDFTKEMQFVRDGGREPYTAEDALKYITFPIKASKKQGNGGTSVEIENTDLVGGADAIIPGSKLVKTESNTTMYNIITELERMRNRNNIVRINAFTYDILQTVHSSGKVSPKQEEYIRKGFAPILRNIEKYQTSTLFSAEDKVFDIIETFEKNGKLSDKQLAHIVRANKRINNYIEHKDGDNFDFSEDSPF